MSDMKSKGVADVFPTDLKEFIVRCFDSVGSLEVLLWLRDHRGGWTPEELGKELRSNPYSATVHLRRLHELSLVVLGDDGRYSFRPESIEIELLITELAVRYASHRVSVIGMIYEPKPTETIRAFADAFKIRKD